MTTALVTGAHRRDRRGVRASARGARRRPRPRRARRRPPRGLRRGAHGRHRVQVEVLVADLTDRDAARRGRGRVSPTTTGPSTCWSTTRGSASTSSSSAATSTRSSAMLDVLVTAVMRLTPRGAARHGRHAARAASSTSRASRASSRAAPTARRSRGCTVFSRVGRPPGRRHRRHASWRCAPASRTPSSTSAPSMDVEPPAGLDVARRAGRSCAARSRDFGRGKPVSVPGAQYKALSTLARYAAAAPRAPCLRRPRPRPPRPRRRPLGRAATGRVRPATMRGDRCRRRSPGAASADLVHVPAAQPGLVHLERVGRRRGDEHDGRVRPVAAARLGRRDGRVDQHVAATRRGARPSGEAERRGQRPAVPPSTSSTGADGASGGEPDRQVRDPVRVAASARRRSGVRVGHVRREHPQTGRAAGRRAARRRRPATSYAAGRRAGAGTGRRWRCSPAQPAPPAAAG